MAFYIFICMAFHIFICMAFHIFICMAFYIFICMAFYIFICMAFYIFIFKIIVILDQMDCMSVTFFIPFCPFNSFSLLFTSSPSSFLLFFFPCLSSSSLSFPYLSLFCFIDSPSMHMISFLFLHLLSINLLTSS